MKKTPHKESLEEFLARGGTIEVVKQPTFEELVVPSYGFGKQNLRRGRPPKKKN